MQESMLAREAASRSVRRARGGSPVTAAAAATAWQPFSPRIFKIFSFIINCSYPRKRAISFPSGRFAICHFYFIRLRKQMNLLRAELRGDSNPIVYAVEV